MNRFFSFKLYIQGIKKMRAAGIATAVFIVITNLLVPLVNLFEQLSRKYDSTSYVPSISPVTYAQLAPCALFILILAPIIVLSAFSFLNDRKRSDFYHSLPQRRECVFISFMLSALTWGVGTVVLSVIVNSILWSLVPYHSLSILTVLIVLCAFVVLTLLMMSVTALAMTVTGTPSANVLITLLFMFFFRLIGFMFLWALDENCFVFVQEHSPLNWLSFEYFLPTAMLSDLFGMGSRGFSNPPLIVYTLVVALAFLALACLLYCKRKSEIAGKSAPSRILQHVYRCAITLPLLILTVILIVEDGLEGYHLVLLALSLLVYLLFELITTKRPKNLIKTLPMFLIPVLASIVFMLSVTAAGAMIESVDPEPDEIVGVALCEEEYGNSYEELFIKDVFVSDRDVAELVSNALKFSTSPGASHRGYVSLSVRIRLNGGRIVARDLLMTTETKNLILELMESSEEISSSLLELPPERYVTNVGITGLYHGEVDSAEIWDIFREEYALLSDEQKMQAKGSFLGNEYGEDRLPADSLGNIWVSGYYKLEYFHSTYAVYPELMPKTAAAYMKLFNESHYSFSATSSFKELATRLESAKIPTDGTYYFVEISIRPVLGGEILSFGVTNETYAPQAKLKTCSELMNVIGEAASSPSASELDNAYEINVVIEGIFPESYTDEYGDYTWYEYIRNTYYFNISPENAEQIAALFK